ncbi:hypothetical protein [Streptomyces globisporus]|uniref:hypothetical protein n=1 Tax=Streptomyces globisporus TaxID=1908 RepID=UPI00345F49D0|nr:hypothetical protein OG838_00205 [Streptomyces globisporus]
MTLTRGPDGRQAASVTPGPGRKGLLFRTLEQDGRVTSCRPTPISWWRPGVWTAASST